MIKIFSACNFCLPEGLLWVLWAMAAATMTVGNVLALLQRNVKRILAYSSIAHTGYMLIALLVGPATGEGPMHDGVVALLFYVAIYGAMNLGAFALLTLVLTLCLKLAADYLKSCDAALLAALLVNVGYWGSGLLNFSFWSAWWQVGYLLLTGLCLTGWKSGKTD